MRKTCLRIIFAFGAMLPALAAHAAADAPRTIGWVEEARIFPGSMFIMAKLDTGALSTSINAHDIEEFERDGERWVRFRVVNRAGRSRALELPVVRDVVIKDYDGKKHERPIVLLGICIGDTFAETEVSLIDRTGFLYPLLVGRRYIADRFLIDAGRRRTVKPDCGDDPGNG